MAREEDAHSQGLDENRIYRPYCISDYNLEDCVDYLAMFHVLYAGLFIDEYYLLHAPLETPLVPLLPLLIPELIDEIYQQYLPEIMDGILNYYEFLYASVEAKGEGFILPEMRLNYAEMLWELGDRDKSQNQIYKSIADWLRLRGQPSPLEYPELLTQFKQLVTASSHNYVAHLNRCLIHLGEFPIKLPDLCLDRALNLSQQQRYTEAIAMLNEVIELRPNYGKAYYYLGLCHSHLQRYQDAILFYDHAIDLGYRLDNVHHHRGYSYFKLKLYDEAIADYQQAVRLGCKQAKQNLKVVKVFQQDQLKREQEQKN
ncbi:MAG: tetratricopeptide repeat protein [Synechococcaceae cyanobacterium RL_1_2]|nr:tetratricopeptide repeat protein [Synechococcaceae cyanobacterium RL_1_2]